MRLALAALLSFCLIAPNAQARTMEDATIVVMRTIDKLSARTHTFEIPVDKTVKFGNSLFIKVRACRKASPLDRPESAAFMQIWERKPSEKDAKWIFSGWMFASNPSLSAMDHPIYDVWIMECKNAVTSAKSEVFSSEKTPEHAPAQDASTKPAVVPVVDTEAAPAKDDEAAEDTEAAPDKPEAAAPPASTPAPAAKPPLVPVPATPAPATVTPAVPATQDVTPPAAKPSPMPPIDKLPGSFEDGNE